METRTYIPDFETCTVSELQTLARRIEWRQPEEAASLRRIARDLEARFRERAIEADAPVLCDGGGSLAARPHPIRQPVRCAEDGCERWAKWSGYCLTHKEVA